MSGLQRADTVTNAIFAAQQVAATIPLRDDDNDDETIHGLAMEEPKIAVDTSMFDALSDFNLDLCLSTTPSSENEASIHDVPPPSPSPPSSPVISRTFSFAKHSRKTSASSGPADPRGSWPMVKYAGRGTPIDRTRLLEWGGFAPQVTEDGFLHPTTIRSTSLDSAVHRSTRSLSSEWDRLTVPSSDSTSGPSELTSRGPSNSQELVPILGPLQIEGLGTGTSDEWTSIMKTVLASSRGPLAEALTPTAEGHVAGDEPGNSSTSTASTPLTPTLAPHSPTRNLDITVLSQEEIDDLGVRMQSHLDLTLHPVGANGRDSPSVYSRHESSMAQSVHGTRSVTTFVDTNSGAVASVQSVSLPWWRRVLVRFRKVQTLVTFHKTHF